MKRKWTALALAAALLASAGCGGNAAPPQGSEGGGLSVSVTAGSQDEWRMNPQTAGTMEGISVSRHLYEGLYKLGKDGNIVPGQAESVDVSDDGLTYTFHLREGISWSDGKAVTAADFVDGWEYLKASDSDYRSILDMVASSQAPDDKTLVVTLSYACSYLPSVLVFPPTYPARKDYIDQYGDRYGSEPGTILYNGAYELAEYTPQQSAVMKKRADYYGASEITVEQITWDLMSETSTMLASFRTGDVIYAAKFPEEEAAALKGNGLATDSGYNSYCVMFNIGPKGPQALKDLKVRQALTLAIDRSRLASIRAMDDEISNTYSPSGLKNAAGAEFNSTVAPWYDLNAYEANCEQAKALLAEAGFAGGAGFPAMKYIVNNEGRKQIAEAVVGDWKDVLGIESVTVELMADGFFPARNGQDYDIAYFGWFMDYPDISNMLQTMTSSANSDSGFASAEYDAAFAAATAAATEEEQWENYRKCEAILAANLPVAPLLHQQNSYLFDGTAYQGLVYYCGTTYFGFITKK
jgi:oligopeptide transport system substrate-binding protein